MNIPKDYAPNLIRIGGYARILVSKALNSIIDIFDSPNTITFECNNEPPNCICICNENTCEKCKEGILGIVEVANSITSDPGENVEIRIFDDAELTSSIFTNEHSVYVDSDYQLTLIDAQSVIQESTDEIKIDNLIIGSVNNLLIKENEVPSLDFGCTESVFMSTISIEISGLLRIGAYKEGTGSMNNVQFSNLNITGEGEINLFYYPKEYVNYNETNIRMFNGYYVICNEDADPNSCNVDKYDSYLRKIGHCSNLNERFAPNTKIVIVINSFSDYLNVEIDNLDKSEIIFISSDQSGSELKVLKENKGNVRIQQTSTLTFNSDSTNYLSGSNSGSVYLHNENFDLFTVAFNDKLTIKQEGNMPNNINPLSIEPQNEKATIIIDKDVKLEQKIVDISSETNIQVTVLVSDKNIGNDEIENIIGIDKNKVSIKVEHDDEPSGGDDNKPDEGGDNPGVESSSDGGNPPNDKFPIGGIIGIVCGAVIVVAVIVVVVIIVIKRKKNQESTEEISN